MFPRTLDRWSSLGDARVVGRRLAETDEPGPRFRKKVIFVLVRRTPACWRETNSVSAYPTDRVLGGRSRDRSTPITGRGFSTRGAALFSSFGGNIERVIGAAEPRWGGTDLYGGNIGGFGPDLDGGGKTPRWSHQRSSTPWSLVDIIR